MLLKYKVSAEIRNINSLITNACFKIFYKDEDLPLKYTHIDF